jgi:hypothetical protein
MNERRLGVTERADSQILPFAGGGPRFVSAAHVESLRVPVDPCSCAVPQLQEVKGRL